ncbi:glycine-rich protein-like [Euwallacea fornicatus]|uniref:glycine-rich protein-like n=1 Tax=Euwallacea fornicatus TaxID=995702 RepID=UPI00338F2A47
MVNMQKLKMFKTIALLISSVVLAEAAPGYYGGYHHGYPAATSYSSRIDIHGPEYIKTYPVLTKAVVATPIVKTVLPSYGYGYQHTPVLGYGGYGYGLGNQGYGLSHGYGSLGHYY